MRNILKHFHCHHTVTSDFCLCPEPGPHYAAPLPPRPPGGRLRFHISISAMQINVSPASHRRCTSISSQPEAISLLSTNQTLITISTATVFGSTSPTGGLLTVAVPSPLTPPTLPVSPQSVPIITVFSGPVPGPCEPEDLIDGIIFAANYLGSTQLLSERNPSKNIRMMQAQEAVSRVKVF